MTEIAKNRKQQQNIYKVGQKSKLMILREYINKTEKIGGAYGEVAFKGAQCGRMDHHVWQVVPGTN